MAVIEEIIEEPVAPAGIFLCGSSLMTNNSIICLVIVEEKNKETLETKKVVEADPDGDIFFDSEEYQTEELEVSQI